MQTTFWKRTILVPTTAVLISLAVEPPGAAEDVSSDPQAEETETPRATVKERIVVSANRIELPARNVGSSISVIDREEIDRRHQLTVLDLLRTVAGLEVARTGGPGKTTSVFIRGGSPAHTLVLMDGVRVNNNSDGAFNFSDLTADNIDRIEILRGPQGTLYGSEAVAGVISLTTRRGEGPRRLWAGGELGTENLARLRAGVAGGTGKLDYSVTASWLTTDGVSAASEAAGNTEDDPWQNATVSGRFGSRLPGDGRIDLSLRHYDGDTDVDGFAFGVGPIDAFDVREKQDGLAAALTVTQPLKPWWTQIVSLGSNRYSLAGEDPNFGDFEIDSDSVELLLQSNLTVSDRDTLSFGYRIEKRQAENRGSFDDSLYLRSFFFENLWSWKDRYHFTLSARNDDHSVFGDETTYRFTTSLRVGETTRLHGSVGTGFKAPTFNDLYFPGLGNPNLDPETSSGFDLGIEETRLDGRLVLDATYFDSEFEDLIQFVFPAGFDNVAAATSGGLEVSVRWQPTTKLLLQGSFARTDTEDRSTGLPLSRRPKARTTLSVAFQPYERLRGMATLVAVRDRIDFDGTVMDDYERVDLTFDYQADRRLRPYLRMENLFDEDYAEVPGFTTPGFAAAVGIEASFQ